MFKKLFIGGGVFVVACLVILWVIGGKNLQTSILKTSLLALSNKEEGPVKKAVVDQDGDKIPDWEEEYRGTDPTKPNILGDTNADEAALTLVRRAQEQKTEPLVSVDNFTGQGAKVYVLSDLNLVDKSEADFIKLYGQNLSHILASFKNPGIGYELPLTLETAEAGKNHVEELTLAANRYFQIIDALVALDTPKSAEQIHLNLINTLSKLGYSAILMSQIETEPTLALAAANFQTSNLRQFLQDIASVNLFFAAPTLSLEDSEKLTISLGI